MCLEVHTRAHVTWVQHEAQRWGVVSSSIVTNVITVEGAPMVMAPTRSASKDEGTIFAIIGCILDRTLEERVFEPFGGASGVCG